MAEAFVHLPAAATYHIRIPALAERDVAVRARIA
jgi:hypothetical protein